MTNKELQELLAQYPDEMEVVLDRMGYDEMEPVYDPFFEVNVNNNSQLVIN